MSNAESISSDNSIEFDVYEGLSSLESTGQQTTSKKEEEEGNSYAISGLVVSSEIAASEADALHDKGQMVVQNTHADLGSSNRRYKNPILAIFAVMSVARKTMQDVAKSSKEESRILKKHWEHVSHEVSGHHDTAATSSERIQFWSSIVGMALTFGPQFLKGQIPEDIKIDSTNPNSPTHFIQWRDAWGATFDNLAQKISTWEPSNILNSYLKDQKDTVEWINWGAQNGQKMSEPMFQQWGQSTQMSNARDTTVGQQQNEASRIEYQSRQDEKRNEDEGVKTIDQMTQRLMEQEVRAFEVRG